MPGTSYPSPSAAPPHDLLWWLKMVIAYLVAILVLIAVLGIVMGLRPELT